MMINLYNKVKACAKLPRVGDEVVLHEDGNTYIITHMDEVGQYEILAKDNGMGGAWYGLSDFSDWLHLRHPLEDECLLELDEGEE